MSLCIIVRPTGYSSKKHSAPRFHPHFNRTMDRYYHSSSDYYSDLKSKGLEPYDPNAPDSGKRQSYKPSENLRRTVQSIHEHTKKGKFKPSDRLCKQMESMGVKMRPTRNDLKYLPAHYQGQGGFGAAE